MNNYLKHIGILIGLFVQIGFADAQNMEYKHFTTNAGLPSSEVYHVFQSSDGYIWFATDMGASRFDGYEFETFDINKGLLDNTVFEIYEDFKKRIWFITLNCKLAYFENGKIVPYKYNDTIAKNIVGAPNPYKKGFYVDSLDNVYISLPRSGLMKIDKNGVLEKIRYDKDRSYILEIHQIEKDVFLPSLISIQLKDTISVVMDNKAKDYPFKFLGHNSSNRVFGLMMHDTLLVGIGRTVIGVHNQKIVSRKVGGSDIIWMEKQNENLHLSYFYGGLNSYSDARMQHRTNLFLNEHSVSSVLKDNEGSYWFTTLKNGVYYLYDEKIKSDFDIDLDNKITDLQNYNDQKIYIVYHDRGVYDFDIQSETKKIIFECKKQEYYIKRFYSLKYFPAFVLATTSNAKMLYKNTALDLVDEKTKKKISTMHCFIEKPDSSLLMGCVNGLFYLKLNDPEHNTSYNLHKRITNLRVYSIEYTNDSTLLIGTISGLYAYKNDTLVDMKKVNPIFQNRVTQIIHIKDRNEIWYATKGVGIVVEKNGKYLYINYKAGLSSNSITSLLYDKEHNTVWAGSNLGLNKIEVTNDSSVVGKITYINYQKGLLSNEVNALQKSGNTLYVGTSNGLNYFDIDQISPYNGEVPIRIKRISVNYRDTMPKKHFDFKYFQNNISIEFVGLLYRKRGNVKYRYRLDGYSDKWLSTDKNIIDFTNLPSGEYKFSVNAQNEAGFWSSRNESFTFHIKTDYFRSPIIAFAILTLLFGSILIVLIVVFKNKQIRNGLNSQLAKEINKSLSINLNPHFIFNSLNSINSFVLSNDALNSNFYLTEFSSLIRKTLEYADVEFIPVKTEIEILNKYLSLELLRLNKSFDYTIQVDPNLSRSRYEIPKFFIQPFVENIIWHAFVGIDRRGNVEIELALLSEDKLFISIKDNGIGREKAKENNKGRKRKRRSMGISNNLKRIDLYNKLYKENKYYILYTDLYDNNNSASGTKIDMVLPAQKTSLTLN